MNGKFKRKDTPQYLKNYLGYQDPQNLAAQLAWKAEDYRMVADLKPKKREEACRNRKSQHSQPLQKWSSQLYRVNGGSHSKIQMKNQSLKLNLNNVAEQIHSKELRIKEQEAAIMALSRELTRDYPNYLESEGMDYVEKEIIDIGKKKKEDWG